MFQLIALVAGGPDYQPIIVAVAAVIALCGPALVAYLQAAANGRKLDAVLSTTNGDSKALREANSSLHAKIDDLRVEARTLAGGATPLPNVARAVPLWDQLRDPNPDGKADRYSTTDCGEECSCMVARACRGVIVAEGDARMQMGGPLRPGLTNGDDLVALLRSWNFTPHLLTGPADAVAALMRPLLAAGHPLICLGEWITPGVLHWVVLTDISPGWFHFADPWHGQRRSLSTEAWSAAWRGVAVDAGEPVRATAA